MNRLANWIKAGIDLDKLLEISNVRQSLDCRLPEEATDSERQRQTEVRRTSGLRIGVARDSAFCFYYRENLELLESLGAELVYWSPINEPTPSGLQGLYFGGGYPELYAVQLAANEASKQSVRAFISDGGAVYAECGGLMFLTETIVDLENTEHKMAGIVPTKARMQNRLAALGYMEVTGRILSYYSMAKGLADISFVIPILILYQTP